MRPLQSKSWQSIYCLCCHICHATFKAQNLNLCVFVCFSMFLFSMFACFYSRHISGFRICACHVERKRNIFIRFYAISISRHTWKPKLQFLHSQSLTIHTPHFRRFLYFTCLLIVVCERKHIKKIVCGFLTKTLWNEANKAEFNKNARKCKAFYASLMADSSVIPIKKAKTSQCSLFSLV